MSGPPPPNPPRTSREPLRLHIGGEEVRAGWKILNIQAKPGVDFVGDCTDLSRFADNSVEEIYASHVYEHLGYQVELPRALREAWRVLKPGGILRAGVPDLQMLCEMFLRPGQSKIERFYVQRMMFGGQIDAYDFHKVGLSMDILTQFLKVAGFRSVRRVEEFNLFKDTSVATPGYTNMSLNVIAMK